MSKANKNKKKKDVKKETTDTGGGSENQSQSPPTYFDESLLADPSINELLGRFDLPDILKETLIKCIREGNTSGIDPLLYQLDGEEQRELAASLLAPKDTYTMQYMNNYSHANNRGIHVGWYSAITDLLQGDKQRTDHSLATFCKMHGNFGYNFVCYPIGGMQRACWTPEQNSPVPAIDLPDLQLQNHLWETYINATSSFWIDPDSPDEWLAKLSEEKLEEELSYLTYLGLRSIVIELKHRDSPRLAAIVKRWLWEKNGRFTIWIAIPSDDSVLLGDSDHRDLWEIWADFRILCENYSCTRLVCGIKMLPTLADEFCNPDLYRRWRGEPLSFFWYDTDTFISEPETHQACLSLAHSRLLSELWFSSTHRVLVSSCRQPIGSNLKTQFVKVLRTIIGNKLTYLENLTSKESTSAMEIGYEYIDALQVPLQPLSDNLDSTVYETFEQDPVKYVQYKNAILQALFDNLKVDKAPIEREIVIMVLGAGRGPLVTAALEADKDMRKVLSHFTLKLYAIEKNPNSFVTLQYCNKNRWNNQVELLNVDMRHLEPLLKEGKIKQPDIIVSELLGSFADNELSPECLDGVTSILKPTTVSIPQSYRSYIVPIHSLRMHQSVISCEYSFWNKRMPGKGRDTSHPSRSTDALYVVALKNYCPLGEPQRCFEFTHPNFEKKPNTRGVSLSFTSDKPSEIMGFAGYFDVTLYNDVFLSIVPGNHSKAMISWFPVIIPLQNMLRLKPGTKYDFNFTRKTDQSGVWYEWFVEYLHPNTNEKIRTPLQNENGAEYYLRL